MKTENKQRRRGLIPLIAILALLLIAGIAGGSYAYWAGSVAGASKNTANDENINITIGTGKEIQSKISLSQTNNGGGKVLVPAGQTAHSTGENNVESITYTYTVTWDELVDGASADGNTGTLAVSVASKKVGESTDPTTIAHVNVQVPANQTITFGTPLQIQVTITLNEPTNKTNYDLIAGKAIEVVLTFAVTVS